MTSALTRREQAALDCIREHVTDVGYPPSIREVGERIGLKSSASVAYVLDSLVAKGYIRRDPRKVRALAILDQS